MEYLWNALTNVILALQAKMDEKYIAYNSYEAIQGLDYLHSNNIIHRRDIVLLMLNYRLSAIFFYEVNFHDRSRTFPGLFLQLCVLSEALNVIFNQ